MKHIKLFEEFLTNIYEGAIPVFPPGNPYKQEFSMTWKGVATHTKKWLDEKQAFTITVDLDIKDGYNKYIADPKFRSVPMGTWENKDLPLFTSQNPRYKEIEFDMLSVEENKENAETPWIKIVDAKGIEFMIYPFMILDIQKGSSVRDGVFSGHKYLIDKMRAKIMNYKGGKVEVKLQDGSTRSISIADWKKANYTSIDESEEFEGIDPLEELEEFDDNEE